MKEQAVLDAARYFTTYLSETDRRLRRTGSTVPSQEVREQVAHEFWPFASRAQPVVVAGRLFIGGMDGVLCAMVFE
ncbi:MAG: hypothetical protein NZ701_17375 [Roseiflexus sp.]|nr:hypothetical protein [Roseiflexus sp.]